MSDLRDRIADALRTHDIEVDDAGSRCACGGWYDLDDTDLDGHLADVAAEGDLACATQFGFPNGVTVSRQWDGGWRVAWPNPDAPGDWRCFHPMTADEDDRDAALARARQLAKEAPVDDG